MIVDLGETWSSPPYEVRDAAFVLAAGSTVTGVITLPDGATTAATVLNPSTGVYTVDYPSVQAGCHDVLISATGGVLGTLLRRWRDTFTVEDARSVVSLEDAIQHLRAGGVTGAADREQVRWLCLVATSAIESDLGRTIVRRSVTETFDGGASAILLRSTPLISVTAVVENGAALSAGDYTADTCAGIVYRGGQQSPRCWAWGRQNVAVTIVAGYTAAPPVVRKVALNGVQRMWQMSQQMPHPSMDDYGAEEQSRAGVLTPLELAAYNAFRAPGFA